MKPPASGDTSATTGVLYPATLPPDDVDLDTIFQALVSSVAGLPGNLVFPRWQPVVPKYPEQGVNWCSIGVHDVEDNSEGPYIDYDSVNMDGILWEYEELEVIASFYGPNAQSYARLLRVGLAQVQNLEQIRSAGIKYVGCSRVMQAPEKINQQWVRRQDLMLQFRRKVSLVYPVEALQIADIHLTDDTYGVNDTVIVPPGAPIV